MERPKETSLPYLCYDLAPFHPLCGPCQVLTVAEIPMLYCPECRILGHLDLVSHHINPDDAKESWKWPKE